MTLAMSRPSDAPDTEWQIFSHGPSQSFLGAVGRAPSEGHVARRAIAAIAISWLPLAVLSALHALTWPNGDGEAFFTDVATHARYLVAVPALIFAEADCLPWLDRIASHFVRSGLLSDPEVERFRRVALSTRHLLDSRAAGIAIIVLGSLGTAAVIAVTPDVDLPPWFRPQNAGLHLSPAGWWYALVSMPLLLTLLMGWMWRLLLWSHFLWVMARVDLRLLPSHPDGVGGLRFVSCCLRGYRLIAFALGAIVAGACANRILHQGASLADLRNLTVGLAIAILLIFVAPLMVFIRTLREEKRRAFLTYGGVARGLGSEFEQKWLRPGPVDRTTLTVPDFSTTTDLYSVVANASGMGSLPFDLKDLLDPVSGAALPFLPVALLMVLTEAMKLFL
jgi:hypothetical protein